MATNPRIKQTETGGKVPKDSGRDALYAALNAADGDVTGKPLQPVISSGAQDALFGVGQGTTQKDGPLPEVDAVSGAQPPYFGDYEDDVPLEQELKETPYGVPEKPTKPAGGDTGTQGGGSSSGGGSTTTTTTETESKIDPIEPFEPGELDTSIYQDLYGSLSDLQAVYDESMKPYTPKTMEEMQQQAQQEYDSYYTQLRLAAEQSQEAQDLALQQQREGLQSSYDKAREASAQQYRQAYSQADRQMLSRGMQRSSYTGQTLANISAQGAEAQQALWDEQIAAETHIDQQRTQLAQQLAAQLASYDAQQASDILARLQALEDTEYDRSVQAGQQRASLATQMFQYLYQMGRDNITDQEFMLQYLFGAHQQDVSEYQWYTELMETIRQFNLQHRSEMDRTSAYQAKAEKVDTTLRSTPKTGGESTQQGGGTQLPTVQDDLAVRKRMGLL